MRSFVIHTAMNTLAQTAIVIHEIHALNVVLVSIDLNIIQAIPIKKFNAQKTQINN